MTIATRDTSHRLKGILRLISSQYPQEILTFEHDPTLLAESQTNLQNRRRRKRPFNRQHPSQPSTFDELVNRYRYVCFFFVQGNPSHFYSIHCLTIRKRLAAEYHDVMTTFLVNVGASASGPGDDSIFCQGTGFAVLPPTPVLLSMLNISQVPVAIVFETATGQRISRDAMLAMEWNDPQSVINAWQRGKSGLDCTQKALAIASLQTDCVVS